MIDIVIIGLLISAIITLSINLYCRVVMRKEILELKQLLTKIIGVENGKNNQKT